MNPSTRRSLNRLAQRVPHMSFDAQNDGATIVVQHYDPDFPAVTRDATVHQLPDGKWVVAAWNPRALQWQSADMAASFRRANGGISGVFGNSLAAIAGDLRKYRSAVDAIRSALELEEQR